MQSDHKAIWGISLTIGASVAAIMIAFSGSLLKPRPVTKSGSTSDISVPLRVVGGDEFDFGDMPEHTEGHHVWKVINTGTKPIPLISEPSCSCTISDMPTRVMFRSGMSPLILGPGESHDVRVSWKTPDAEGHERRFKQFVRIGRPDQDSAMLDLQVYGNCYPHVVVAPPVKVVQFGSFTSDHDVHREVLVYSRDFDRFRVDGVVSTNKNIIAVNCEQIAIDPRLYHGVDQGWRVRLSLKASAISGAINEEVAIGTNHPMEPEIKLAVLGAKRSWCLITPRRKFTFIEEGAEVNRKLAWEHVVSPTDTGKTTGIVIESVPQGLDVHSTPTSDGTGFIIRMQVQPGHREQSIVGDVIIRSANRQRDRASIPVHIMKSTMPSAKE